MQGSGNPRGWLIHLVAGMALGAAVVLVAWIVAGGQPFGRIIGSDDVSEPTKAAAAATAVQQRAARPAARATRLTARPPELVRAPELRFLKPKAKAKQAEPTRARAPKRAVRPKRQRRTPVVRVVAPPPAERSGEEDAEAPVAAVPSPAPTAAPAPRAPAPSGGGGAKPVKPTAPTYVAGAGEG